MSALKIPINNKDHIQGNKKAIITLLEYSDYECPYCRQAHSMIKSVQKHFTNKLKFVFRHFPLSEIHPYAETAAETAEFADANGKFWEMHDLIYTNQDQLGLPFLFELTKEIGLSEDKLDEALKNGIYRKKIKDDFLSGVYSGVNGTPTFFINDNRYNGPSTSEGLIKAIELQLEEIKNY